MSKEILRIQIRLSYKGCKEDENVVAGMPFILFVFVYCLLQWKKSQFFKVFLPLRNYEIDFSFSEITDLCRAHASEMKKSM